LNLLLDTYIALWAITDDSKLSIQARDLLLAPKNTIWVSAVNVWEIAIKHSLRKSSMPISGKEAIFYFRRAGYQFLSIEPEHSAFVEDLANHHQDPFDRLLVAQALNEPMRLLTHDAIVARYSDTVILV
jgi:PIN domain nuclease of toxin-antitoxin system